MKNHIKLNQPLLLANHLVELIGNAKKIKIVDVGSGPYSIIGSYLPGVDVKIVHCDRQDFSTYWEQRQMTSIIQVEQQNMEKLTYEDNSFDIVNCCNALDHTRNAEKAVNEMIRVCRPGGWVYIRCALDQLSTGYKHYWNAKEDGIVTNNVYTFDLKSFGFKIKYIDKGGERRHNEVIATLKKK